MGVDINKPNYCVFGGQDCGSQVEEVDADYKSSIPDVGHPLFSSSGLIKVLNMARAKANSGEEMLSGEISGDVIENIAKAVAKTGVPFDLIAYAMDFEKDLTSGGGDAMGIAQKFLGYAKELRSSLGREPFQAEVFAAGALGGASKVKTIFDDAQNKPEEKAQNPGGSKAKIMQEKIRSGKIKQYRVNRELYEFFYKRINGGRSTFITHLGKDKYGN